MSAMPTYRLTPDTSRWPPRQSPGTSPQPNFSRPVRIRSPAPVNSRRPHSPPQAASDPMTWGAPDVQKSKPIRYVGSRPAPAGDSQPSRRPIDRSARSMSPLRSAERSPPAHIRAQTPPLPQTYNDEHGFLLPPGEAVSRPASPLSTPPCPPPSAPLPQIPSEHRGRHPERKGSGLVPGMLPGPNFFAQSNRRTTPNKLSSVPSTPDISGPRSAKTAPTTPLPLTPKAPSDLPAPTPSRQSQKPKERVASMCDYLSLEQLEDLWHGQDLCHYATIETPQRRPSAPKFTMQQILEARERIGDLPVHPAFRGEGQAVN